MKKYIAFLLCLMMMLSLFSCKLSEDQDTPSQNDNENNTSTQILDAEKAMEMYEVAIKGEICVFDERVGEIKLSSLRLTSNGLSLDEYKLLKKAVADIDGDGVSEYVIQSPNQEYIILRYYNGNVYSYWLDTGDFYNFNTDGSFHWYDSSEDEGWACGLNRIVFNGETLNIKSIYSIKFSKNPTKYEHFVEGKSVTGNEYDSYRAHNIRYERMRFSQFELSCSYPITAEQAWNLANAYWDSQDGQRDYAAGTVFTAKIELTDTPNSENDYYRVAFQVEWNSNGGREGDECMPPYDIQLHDQILVNAFTGEITSYTYDPNGKGISVEQAIEIAQNYRSYMSGETCNEENGYRVAHDPNATAPDHIYVIVIQKYDTVTDRIWIDKNTGEIIFPYYMYGK